MSQQKEGKSMVNNERFADCIFVVGEEEREIYGHRSRLVDNHYFDSMFSAGLAESKCTATESGGLARIPIHDVRPEIFLALLRVIYNEPAEDVTLDNIGEFCDAADFFQEPKLLAASENLLGTTFGTSAFWKCVFACRGVHNTRKVNGWTEKIKQSAVLFATQFNGGDGTDEFIAKCLPEDLETLSHGLLSAYEPHTPSQVREVILLFIPKVVFPVVKRITGKEGLGPVLHALLETPWCTTTERTLEIKDVNERTMHVDDIINSRRHWVTPNCYLGIKDGDSNSVALLHKFYVFAYREDNEFYPQITQTWEEKMMPWTEFQEHPTPFTLHSRIVSYYAFTLVERHLRANLSRLSLVGCPHTVLLNLLDRCTHWNDVGLTPAILADKLVNYFSDTKIDVKSNDVSECHRAVLKALDWDRVGADKMLQLASMKNTCVTPRGWAQRFEKKLSKEKRTEFVKAAVELARGGGTKRKEPSTSSSSNEGGEPSAKRARIATESIIH